jgi:phosphomannomutase / phosphoglucomutase
MNRNIFRQYDIRGKAESDLTDDVTRALGRALGTFYRRKGQRRIAVGRDCRLSSPRLHAVLTGAMMEAGLELVDIGVVPTPLVYFAVFHLDLDGGVQITGSHNPPDENGFKMMTGKASLFGADIEKLLAMIDASDFELPGGGTIRETDVTPAYLGFIEGNIDVPRKDIRFAIDAGNGSGGPTAVAAMKAAGLDPIALLCDMDGTFPVHHPDPTEPEALELLRQRVLSDGLELGIAFDGDADRLGVIDARGDIVWGDRLMVLFARSVLDENPGAAIIGEVKCSQTLYDDIAKHGGRPILWKTGHSLIKSKMKQEKALLAGEMSGHVFFADRFYGYDDAVYAALRLLEILAKTKKPLHELLSDLPVTYSTPEIRVDCPDDKKFDVVDGVLARFKKTHDVVDVDGARIQFGDGWGLVRASNTQPVLVMRFEALTPARRDEIRATVEAAVLEVRGS